MWTRTELKNKAKFSFKRNYWKCILVSLLITLFAGGSSGLNSASSAFGSGFENGFYDDFNQQIPYDSNMSNNDYGNDIFYNAGNFLDNANQTVMAAAVFMVGAIVMVVVFILTVMIVLADIFLFNPLEIGCKRFFLRNLNENAQVGNIGFAFDNNYKNIIKTMLVREVSIFLWSLLLIVPGIIKAYEYQMIPYLLAENPQMTKEEAFAESKRMMQGQKWNAFLLDLSFLGWDILSVMTFGVLQIFYVRPYKDATYAALYERLRYGVPYDFQDKMYTGNGMNQWG